MRSHVIIAQTDGNDTTADGVVHPHALHFCLDKPGVEDLDGTRLTAHVSTGPFRPGRCASRRILDHFVVTPKFARGSILIGLVELISVPIASARALSGREVWKAPSRDREMAHAWPLCSTPQFCPTKPKLTVRASTLRGAVGKRCSSCADLLISSCEYRPFAHLRSRRGAVSEIAFRQMVTATANSPAANGGRVTDGVEQVR